MEQLLDGDADAVRHYLMHFWSHWSGESFELADADLDHLVEMYSPPGAFIASIGWYRGGSGSVAAALSEVAPTPRDRIHVAATVLWPDSDPLFPISWSDRLEAFFTDVTVQRLRSTGHFTPLEAPDALAAAIATRLA
jgi:pimeloyl-ACP methyl ester carboxylesterase